MKDIIKLIVTVLAGLAGAALPIYWGYQFWGWTMTQVPVNEWAGLIKVGLTFVMIGAGGGLTIFATIMAGMAGGALGLFVAELVLPDKRLR